MFIPKILFLFLESWKLHYYTVHILRNDLPKTEKNVSTNNKINKLKKFSTNNKTTEMKNLSTN